MNSIKNIINQVKYKIYADDIKICREISNKHDIKTLQQNINAISKYAESLKLSLNKKKAYHIRFGLIHNTSAYFLDMKPIEKVKTVRDLGLYVYDKPC